MDQINGKDVHCRRPACCCATSVTSATFGLCCVCREQFTKGVAKEESAVYVAPHCKERACVRGAGLQVHADLMPVWNSTCSNTQCGARYCLAVDARVLALTSVRPLRCPEPDMSLLCPHPGRQMIVWRRSLPPMCAADICNSTICTRHHAET